MILCFAHVSWDPHPLTRNRDFLLNRIESPDFLKVDFSLHTTFPPASPSDNARAVWSRHYNAAFNLISPNVVLTLTVILPQRWQRICVCILTYKMDLTLPALDSAPANPKGAYLPFPLLASGRNAFVATPPATPVCQSKFQSVNSISDTNHSANSVTGILDNVLPRMKEKLQDREVLNLPLDAFLKRFITLENARYELSFLHLFSKFRLRSNSHWFILFL